MGITNVMSWPTADQDTACASAMWAGDVPPPVKKGLQRSSLAVEHLSGARVFKTGHPEPSCRASDRRRTVWPGGRKFMRDPNFVF